MFKFIKQIKKQVIHNQYLATLNTIAEQTKVADTIKISGVEVFDKAMDAVYNNTHIGGGNHRLFDGGHTILGAWKSVQNIEVPFIDKISGTTKALINDFVTDKGLPIITIKQDTYNNICKTLPMIPRKDIYDLFKVNIYDILPIFKTLSYARFIVKDKETNDEMHIGLIACTTAQIIGQSSAGLIISVATTVIAIGKHILANDYVGMALNMTFGIAIGYLSLLNPIASIPLIFVLKIFNKRIRIRIKG